MVVAAAKVERLASAIFDVIYLTMLLNTPIEACRKNVVLILCVCIFF